MNTYDFDDSLVSTDSAPDQYDTPRHPLTAICNQLEFNGYKGFLTDDHLNIDEEKLKEVFQVLLKRDSAMLARQDEFKMENRKITSELKRMLSKNENLENEFEKSERHLAEVKSREMKQIKRIDELELKLRNKTTESRKLTIGSKNTESKYNIEKRKLEMANSKLKDKITDVTRGPTSKEKQKKLNCIINLKNELEVYTNSRDDSTIKSALCDMEENVRYLVGENQNLKSSLKAAKVQIYDTLSAFPNFEVDFEQSENVNIDTQKVEVEIAKNCQKLTELIKDLDDHYLKQLAEMEEDLGARQEKQLVTKVAEFETKLDEVKAAVVKNKEPEKVSEEEIFQKMAEMIDDDDETEVPSEFNDRAMMECYLQDCSKQTAPPAHQTPPHNRDFENLNERTPEHMLNMFTDESYQKDKFIGYKSSTPVHNALLAMAHSPSRRSGEGIKPSHLVYDNDSLDNIE